MAATRGSNRPLGKARSGSLTGTPFMGRSGNRALPVALLHKDPPGKPCPKRPGQPRRRKVPPRSCSRERPPPSLHGFCSAGQPFAAAAPSQRQPQVPAGVPGRPVAQDSGSLQAGPHHLAPRFWRAKRRLLRAGPCRHLDGSARVGICVAPVFIQASARSIRNFSPFAQRAARSQARPAWPAGAD